MIKQNKSKLPFTSLIFSILLLLLISNTVFGTTFTVTKTDDTNDGVCDTDCSLREAVTASNSLVSDDVIDFDPVLFSQIRTILLGSEIVINNNGSLIINGTGSHLLQLRGTYSYTFNSQRIFYISPNSDVTLNNLFIFDAVANGAVKNGYGGAILNDNAVLKIDKCYINGNQASITGSAIYNDAGTLSISDSVFMNNYSFPGGVIVNFNGNVVMENTEMMYNNGNIENSGQMKIVNSTLLYNSSYPKGGGLNNSGNAEIINSTFNFNLAINEGGAIYNTGNLSLKNATIAGNAVRTISENAGGGVKNFGGGIITAHNTIVAGNVNGETSIDPNAVPSDYNGTLESLGYNLIKDVSHANITGNTTGNILNTDPKLYYIVGKYGGITSTLALKIDSPAIDAGDPFDFPKTDQRGFQRPIDGDGNSSILPDIGAYETTRITAPSTFTVTNTNDSGIGSLRNAIESANASFGSDTINFDPTVFNSPKTITLKNWGLKIASGSSLTINGTGADLLTITTRKQGDVITLDAPDSTAVINALTISDGIVGIYNYGNLTLNDSVVENNRGGERIFRSSTYSTGIYSRGIRTLNNANINRSVIRNNETWVKGGGINIDASRVNINDSTISDNKLTGNGNGNCGAGIGMTNSILIIKSSTVENNNIIFSGTGGGMCASFFSEINLENSTIAENKAGGGIWVDGGVIVNLSSSTIAKNVGIGIKTNGGILNSKNSMIAKNTTQDISGVLNSMGFNLIENPVGVTINGDVTGNIIGVDPRLDPKGLQNNGGETRTIALLSNSPAIDAGNPADFSPIDQRGFPRPIDGDGNGSVLPDIGAFEVQNEKTATSTLFDFDGDGKSDISVFRPSNGAWYINQSTNGFTGVIFGFGTDLLAPADFDGDGKTDVAVFRDGNWFYLKSSNNAFISVTFGQAGDVPSPADFDGDGKADINVFRPSTGSWYRLNSSDNSFYGVQFGQNGDKPLIADFDGDGKNDIAVFRPSTGAFYSLDSSTGAFRGVAFGFGTDIPTLGDFDGDGKTDVAVFRPSNGAWYRLNSSTGAFFGTLFGQNGDIPVPADYDGDGRTDIAVFRNGDWYYLKSSNGAFVGQTFGFGTDKPLPAAFQ